MTDVHLSAVLPIARTIFGDSAVMPIVAIGIVDIMLLYGSTMVMMDATGDGGRPPVPVRC